MNFPANRQTLTKLRVLVFVIFDAFMFTPGNYLRINYNVPFPNLLNLIIVLQNRDQNLV